VSDRREFALARPGVSVALAVVACMPVPPSATSRRAACRFSGLNREPGCGSVATISTGSGPLLLGAAASSAKIAAADPVSLFSQNPSRTNFRKEFNANNMTYCHIVNRKKNYSRKRDI
jgi:hypothetical protein